MKHSASGKRRGGRALIVNGLDESASVTRLERLNFADRDERHNESWIQSLIHAHPQVLPITELEPAFSDTVSICRELPLPDGFLDNLLVTPRGEIVLVECKLWRNPQARREVVAQIIEYAQCLAKWSYEEFDNAVRKATGRGSEQGVALYDLVAAQSDAIEEEDFVDAVARNLSLGRFLLIVAGDGIQEGVERLKDYLEQHAGFHFTLALVELCVHSLPDGGYLVTPQIMARTLNIERAIVRIENGKAVVLPVERQQNATSHATQAHSISEAQLFEALERHDPSVPRRLRAFAERLDDLGVKLEMASKSLVVRWRNGVGDQLNLGGITETGEYYSEYANWAPDKIGRVELAHQYQDRIAEIVGGHVRKTNTPYSWYVVVDGTQKPRIGSLLDREEEWERAARSLITGFEDALATEAE